MVQKALVEKKVLEEVFGPILAQKVLPEFQLQGRAVVSHSRQYVEDVLRITDSQPTLPKPSQEKGLPRPSSHM